MSDRLDARAEVITLARLLEVGEDELAFVLRFPAGDIRALREAATDRLFDSSARLLAGAGAAARVLPTPIVATIAQRAFGPILCARVAGAIDTGKAIDVARRLPTAFVADIAAALDPRRAAAILSAVPDELVVAVAGELGPRGEFVTMGRFLGYLSDRALERSMRRLDDATLLRTAFVLEDKRQLNRAVSLLPPERLAGILRCADEDDLWPEALDLLDHLSPPRRVPIAEIVADLDEPVLEGLIDALTQEDIWDSLLPLVAVMGQPALARLASRAPFHRTEVMGPIIAAAAAGNLWADIVPLITAVPPESRGPIAELVAEQDDSVIASILEVAGKAHLYDDLLAIVASMSPGSRARFATAPAICEPETMEAIVSTAADQGLWTELVPLIDVLPEPGRSQLPAITARLEAPRLRAILHEVARHPQTLPALLQIAGDMDRDGRRSLVAAIEETDRATAQDLLGALCDPRERDRLAALLSDDLKAAVLVAADRLGLREELPMELRRAG